MEHLVGSTKTRVENAVVYHNDIMFPMKQRKFQDISGWFLASRRGDVLVTMGTEQLLTSRGHVLTNP